ncbi:TetR/AcrR family transcriptional regulator [Flavobacteriaceae bacterium 3-367]|uniref:TetR/AcrR family transcriptional regulator n=1 Tax=Eudoraea algarum TaxID=3417568 RepID=UPI003286198D
MKRSEIRQHIVETASELFYAKGYNATGINEIIAEAGIAKATLYHHFRSKDAICIAYLKHKHHHFMHALTDFIRALPKGKGRILGVFDFLSEFYREPNFSGCWCIRTVAEIPADELQIRTEIQQQKKELLTFLREVILDNHTDVSKRAAKELAHSLYLLYEGAVSESHLHQNDWPIKSAKNIGAQLIS